MCQRRILYDGICVNGIFEKNKIKEKTNEQERKIYNLYSPKVRQNLKPRRTEMKQTEYNIKTRQCKTNYSPDPWGELKAINDRAIIDNMIKDYTYINKKQNVLREDLI